MDWKRASRRSRLVACPVSSSRISVTRLANSFCNGRGGTSTLNLRISARFTVFCAIPLALWSACDFSEGVLSWAARKPLSICLQFGFRWPMCLWNANFLSVSTCTATPQLRTLVRFVQQFYYPLLVCERRELDWNCCQAVDTNAHVCRAGHQGDNEPVLGEHQVPFQEVCGENVTVFDHCGGEKIGECEFADLIVHPFQAGVTVAG